MTSLAMAQDGRDRVLMLGPWCVDDPDDVLDREVVGALDCVPYHWDDRAKLAADYDALEVLHDKVLDALSSALNRLHGVEQSRRCWRLLLDPWLMAYIAVQFDRFEQLRAAFSSGEKFTLGVPTAMIAAPFSYDEFFDDMTSDVWNSALCARICAFQYGQRVTPIEIECRAPVKQGEQARAVRGLSRLLTNVDRWISPWSRRNRVAFVDSYFGLPALVRLSLRLRCVPRLYRSEFSAHFSRNPIASGVRRQDLRVDISPRGDFEKFLATQIVGDLPSSILEHFACLAERARALRFTPDVIVTAAAHWGNLAAKFWMADCVQRGSRLLVHNHGGSLPARKEFFGWESEIADVRGTWFRPHGPKHLQMPPSKLVADRREKQAGGYASAPHCLVVGNEYPRWTFRAHFAPCAQQCLRSYRQVLELAQRLDADIRGSVRVRPAPPLGWNLPAAFAKNLGEAALSRGGSLTDAFAQARVIVCTYPETTLCEAMASGRPVVFLYPEDVYERHAIAQEVMVKLRSARILFTDSTAAAAHVSQVWKDIDAWWRDPAVLAARDAFVSTAMPFRGDWIRPWLNELRRLLAMGDVRPLDAR